jgi:hypothetical protein
MRNSTHSPRSVSPITCHAPMHISKMGQLNANIDTVEVGLSLLAQAHMPLKFWDETFIAATFLINRTPSKVISYATPLERLYKVQPNYSALRIFGCGYWPNLRPYNQRKLQFRSKECIFLGYSNLHKGFK